jgi:hypothetical protein
MRTGVATLGFNEEENREHFQKGPCVFAGGTLECMVDDRD